MSDTKKGKTEQNEEFDKFKELARKLIAIPRREVAEKLKKKSKRTKQPKK